MQRTAKQQSFSPAELVLIQRAAVRQWNYIGGDVLNAVADGSGATNPVITRAEVIEVVLDQGLNDQLRTLNVSPALIERWQAADYEERLKAIKPAFPFARYGR